MPNLNLRPCLSFVAASFLPNVGWSHGFGERYDLPVPMIWVIAAACCVVLLSFLITPFIQHASGNVTSRRLLYFQLDGPVSAMSTQNSWWSQTLKVISVSLLMLTWSAAMWGSADPLMNFSPTFIWIIWWLGTSFVCILFGNVWHHIDPWLAVFKGCSQLRRFVQVRPKEHSGPLETFRLRWPSKLARWPACAMLLCWSAIEIIYPIASMPHRVGFCIAAYSLTTWTGMWLFGPSTWRHHADGFSLYFELTSQARNMLLGKTAGSMAKIEKNTSATWSTVGLVIAIFTSVLFDGLHAGPGWLIFEKWASRIAIFQTDVNGYLMGSTGLLTLWLLLCCTYVFTCFATSRMLVFIAQNKNMQVDSQSLTLEFSNAFLASMMPIAMAYLIAHNFSSFVIQGQNIIALASDPMGWGWNIWGTSHYYPDVGLVDAKFTWYVATLSIVIGHVVSVIMAHRVACLFCTQLASKQNFWALILNIPMTLVMIGFTALSLTLIAEPLVSS